jgi:UDP-N-acetylglucosamine pyrophosphorylase
LTALPLALSFRKRRNRAKKLSISASKRFPSQVVGYDDLGADASVEFLNKLAVVKLNGGLGTSRTGCPGRC